MNTRDRYDPHDIVWTDSAIDRFWDFYSGTGNESSYFGVQAGDALLKLVNRMLPLAGRRVLDYGCGSGALLEKLCRLDVECIGLEFSELSANVARSRLAKFPSFGGVTSVKAIPSAIPDDSVDVVLLCEVIEHLLDDRLGRTLGEIRRVLRPGGHVVVTTPNDEDLSLARTRCPECGCTYHRWQHVRSFDSSSIGATMREAGFETRDVIATDFALDLPLRSSFVPRLRAGYRRLVGRPLPLPNLVYLGVNPRDRS